jgi:plastocyanin
VSWSSARRRRGTVIAVALSVVAGLALAAGGAAMTMTTGGARSVDASISGAGFSPARMTVLAGDTVTWTDAGGSHTVTSDDNAFASGTLAFNDKFSHRFAMSGTYRYYCAIHRYMTGEVDVADVLLNPPPVAAAPNRTIALGGRAALSAGTTLTVQADTGSGFSSVGSTTVASDGTFDAMVTPRTTTTYRILNGDEASPAIRLLVVDRHVTVTATHRKHGVLLKVKVLPAAPGATVVAQLNLRERFGWWPVQQKKLDRSSSAKFLVHPPYRVSARVALTLTDGATRLAVSKGVRIRP